MPRADLLALSEDGLVQLANAGLVKRGLRDLAAGQGPVLTETADGTIEARFADGILTRLAASRSPGEASCTCPASGMCRHRVSLVLAYRQSAMAGAPAAPSALWDPGTLDVEALEASWSAAGRSEMKRLRAAPLTVTLDHGAVPVARLPMATVRFLVPGDIAYARCDCTTALRCPHVALAIHAFRAAAGAREATLSGESAPDEDTDALTAAVDAVLSRLLAEGIVAGMAGLGRVLDQARAAAGARGATWLALALEELAEQVAAYESRSARHEEDRVLALAGEIFARTRASDRASALGLGEAMEVPMAKTRLISLGARVTVQGPELTAKLLLADTDTGTVMQLERRFAAQPGEERLTTDAIRMRPFTTGLPIEGAARGQILTAAARRRADGGLMLGAGGRGRTLLMPRAALQELPAPLQVAALAPVAVGLAARAPSFLRPRSRVLDVHVFEVSAVLGQAWAPGAQQWHAAVALPCGSTLHLERRYDAAAPWALEVLFATAAGEHGPIRQLAGPIRLEGGMVICDPWSLSTGRLVIPDFDRPDQPAPAPSAASRAEAAEGPAMARGILAGALHVGRRQRDRDFLARGEKLAIALRAQGYRATGDRVTAWLRSEPGDVRRFGEAAIWCLALLET